MRTMKRTEKRTEQFSVYMTPSEVDELEAWAEEYGMPVAVACRVLAFMMLRSGRAREALLEA